MIAPNDGNLNQQTAHTLQTMQMNEVPDDAALPPSPMDGPSSSAAAASSLSSSSSLSS